MRRTLMLTLALVASFLGRPVAARNPIVDEGLADPSVKVFGRDLGHGFDVTGITNDSWLKFQQVDFGSR